MHTFRNVGLSVVVIFFAVGGIAHFTFAAAEIAIIPPAIPFPEIANGVAGVCELLGAIGICVPQIRRFAGMGLALLTIAVTPANVFMLQHADHYPKIPVSILVARLPLQLLLLWLIVWSCQVFQSRVRNITR